MKIDYVKVGSFDHSAFNQIAEWYNNTELISMLNSKVAQNHPEAFTPEEFGINTVDNFNTQSFIIKDETTNIGECSIDMKYSRVLKKEFKTAWISFCIAEQAYRGIGVSNQTVIFIENMCRVLGAERIGLGIFDNSSETQELLSTMGYTVISTLKNAVNFRNQWHNDIRMEKFLQRKNLS